jgi:hypothetical protein
VCPLRKDLGFYIPEDGILHSHPREHLRSYIFIKHIHGTNFIYIYAYIEAIKMFHFSADFIIGKSPLTILNSSKIPFCFPSKIGFHILIFSCQIFFVFNRTSIKFIYFISGII